MFSINFKFFLKSFLEKWKKIFNFPKNILNFQSVAFAIASVISIIQYNLA